jgi:hypothetical protein
MGSLAPFGNDRARAAFYKAGMYTKPCGVMPEQEYLRNLEPI